VNANFEAAQRERAAEEERVRAEEERQRPAVRSRAVRAQEMAEQIARHGPCRAYPRHPNNYADAAGNCSACVIGLR
jgi:hypothetical protein